MPNPPFVHLHLHSHYSLLDGLSKIPDLVAKAVSQGAPALALTDHGAMYGAIEHYLECKKAGIKPIVGCEVYVTTGKLTDRETKRGERNFYHLTLLAKNHTGYVNLMKMTTEAHTKGFYYRPRIDHEVMESHAEGIICLSGCMNSELSQALLAGNMTEARRILEWHRNLFKDNYYLEVQHHPNIPEQGRLNDALIELSQEYGLPLVATTDSHYLCTDDAEAQDVLLCIQTGAKVDDTNRMSMIGELFDLKEPSELAEAFKHIPEAITNTVKIAEGVDLEIPMGQNILPKFEVPEGETIDSYFDKKIEEGIIKRFGSKVTPEVRERLKYEIGVIDKAGFTSYMLIVADFTNWAKDQRIMVGPGRGSAAGSMVAYVLGITELDPIEHKLPFERFLNPERIAMPDIDMDFADDRRGEVIEYARNKYGRDHVAQIITFGTMMSRAAVRDVGRAMNLPYADVDRIAKLVPPPQQGKYTSLAEHIEAVPELKSIYTTDASAKKLLDMSQKLERTVRHASVHAAGVVIGDQDLTCYTPLQCSPSDPDILVTQYSMKPVEALGLLKMDFLGLKNLTIVQNALRIMRKIYDQDIDITKLKFDDPKTFDLLASGNTTGVFQLESEGMRRAIRELKPTTFDDISAMIALYRPGPMQFINDFIDCKHGRKKVEYLHPKLEPILRDTYGIAVFQEQVMQITRDLCGFTMGEADVLRKAMGKKDPKLLAEQREKFIQGATANGITQVVAEKLFSFIEPFAMYAFNRAHTASYGVITYWTAYLKTHFPSAFMAAVMTSAQQDLDEVAKNIAECEHMGIKVTAPDVNKSFTGFAVVPETGNIVFGLNAIKNVGHKVAEMIIAERDANGVYSDLANFVERAGREVINRKTLESLILSGAMDEFGERNMLYQSLDNILEFAGTQFKNANSTQLGIFGAEEVSMAHTIKLVETEPVNEKDKLKWEREYLGTYVSDHPIKTIGKKLVGLARPIGQFTSLDDNQSAKVAGIITRVQKVFTKSGDPMVFVNLEDLSGSMEVIVFPKVYEAHKALWERDKILMISGRVNVKDRTEMQGENVSIISEPKLLVSEAMEITEEYLAQVGEAELVLGEHRAANAPKPLKKIEFDDSGVLIRLPKGFPNGKLAQLKEILAKYPGEAGVVLELYANGSWQKVPTQTRIAKSENLTKDLEEILV